MERLRILIIEDDRDWSDLICSALGEQCECYCAPNGLVGIDLARKGEPDLILLDILMPVMDGWEFLRRARLLPELQKTPVIVLTALASREQAHEAYKAGVRLCLTKPIELPRLRRNIDLFIEDNAIVPRRKRLAFDDLILDSGKSLPLEPAPEAPPSRPAYEAHPPRLAHETQPARSAYEAPPPRSAYEAPPPRPAHETQPARSAYEAPPPRPAHETQSARSAYETQPSSHPKARGREERDAVTQKIVPGPSKATPRSNKKASLLIAVEDQETATILGAGIGVGFDLINARDGIDAAELAIRNKPALFVIDEKLPRMNGHQLLHVLRKEPEFRKTPIIFLSNKSDARHVQRAIQEGVDYCLAKPFLLRDLLDLIERALDVTGLTIREDDTMVGERFLTIENRLDAVRREMARSTEQKTERSRVEQELRRRHGTTNDL
jgi:CheY-like chemotaxis protein